VLREFAETLAQKLRFLHVIDPGRLPRLLHHVHHFSIKLLSSSPPPRNSSSRSPGALLVLISLSLRCPAVVEALSNIALVFSQGECLLNGTPTEQNAECVQTLLPRTRHSRGAACSSAKQTAHSLTCNIRDTPTPPVPGLFYDATKTEARRLLCVRLFDRYSDSGIRFLPQQTPA
jgi:hypothetical protein